MSNQTVSVRDLSFSYDGVETVLSHLSFQQEPGVLAVTGPSGCGKTTLLKLLSGLEEPDEGQIFFGDEDVTRVAARKRKVAFIFQDAGLYPHLTAYQHILMMCHDDLRTKELLSACGIARYVNCKPQHLSRGERQKLALAKCFATDARLYLMDEPMSAIDERGKERLYAYLKEWQREKNAIVLYVSHREEDIRSLADTVLDLTPPDFPKAYDEEE